jgi:hypothetical protein
MSDMVTEENINDITSCIRDVFFIAARETFGIKKKLQEKLKTNSKP